MSSPGPQRPSFQRRFKDGLKNIFHSNPSSRSPSPRPRPSTPSNVLDPRSNEEDSSVEPPTHTLNIFSARLPLTKTQSIPPGFHAHHAGGSAVVHTATELALTSLNLLAAPFTQEPGTPAVSLHASVSSLPQPSAAITSVPIDSTPTSRSRNTTLPVSVQPTLPLDMPSGDSHSHSGSVDEALEVNAVPITSQTTEAQGIVPAPVQPLEKVASAALNDPLQSATSGSGSEGDRTPSSKADSENAEINEDIPEEREAVRLSNLACSYYDAFELSGDLADITEAISAQQTAVQLTAEGDPSLPSWLDDLGILYKLRFNRTGDLADIEAAVAAQQRAVQLTPEDHSDLPSWLNHLGNTYQSRFDHSGELADITEVISVHQRAIQLMPEEDGVLPSWLNSLGNSYQSRFELAGDVADITDAISMQERAVQLTAEGDGSLLIWLFNLAYSYYSRFDHSGKLADITEAISAKQRAIQLTPEGDTTLASRLDDLGFLYKRRFNRTGDLADIEAAVAVQQRAIRLTPEGHADLPSWLNSLGSLYHARFDRTGDLVDIANAIAAKQRAVELTAEGHADLPSRLNNLGISFQSRFGHTGDIADIMEAVSARQIAVQLTREGHEDLPLRLNNLGISLQIRFDRTGDLADIDEAISAQSRAAQLAPEDHASLPGRLSNIGNSYQSRFHRTGDLADVAAAISAQRRAVQLTPDGHADLPLFLNNVGISLQSRFDRTGDLADIAEAISVQQRAVQLTPEGHADVPGRLSNLGNSFQSRFDRTGDLADIAEAISVEQRAVQLTHEGHADLPLWLTNLGISFQSRFDHTGDIADIVEAVSAQQRAVKLTPEGHAGLPGCLNNLGNSYTSRFDRTKDLADIAEAISAHQRGVKLTPEGHADLPTQLNSLGISYQSRFDHTKNIADIAEAISAQQRAVHLTPEGHADLPIWLNNLAISFQSRFDHTGDLEDLNASLLHMQSAATSSFGTPQDRLKASRRWARIMNLHTPLSPDVLTAFEIAINLLALVAGLEQTVKGRYAQLQDAAGIALDGAAAACRLERLDKAVEWLEQGRCLVWNQLNNLRTPLDKLQAHDSQLAQRLTDVSKQLQNAASTRNSLDPSLDMAAKISLQDATQAHLTLAREWDQILTTVRSIPGFESFLQPSPCSTLLHHLPKSSPVVIITVNGDRCDAIALSTTLKGPLHIPLHNFTLEKATRYRHNLDSQLRSRDIRMRDAEAETDSELSERGVRRWKKPVAGTLTMRDVLRGLWIEVVRPILDTLGYTRSNSLSPDAVLPRIWWCLAGTMSFLPIHAAGIYTAGESESVSDYVVSSYTPTVLALTDRVKNCLPIDEAASGLFLTSQPDAPGACSISGTTKEVDNLYARATDHGVKVLRSSGSDLTVQSCLQYMEEFSSIHLACHASQNAADPLQSRFLLHTGELTLGTIIQMNLRNADLAFLSACQTSTGEEKLSDEAVHLAAGMLAAGYRRVVATMWSIKDQHAPDVANDFYEYLWSRREEGSGGGFDGSLSAYALHHATRRLRQRLDNSEESLLTWVPYVHFGY